MRRQTLGPLDPNSRPHAIRLSLGPSKPLRGHSRMSIVSRPSLSGLVSGSGSNWNLPLTGIGSGGTVAMEKIEKQGRMSIAQGRQSVMPGGKLAKDPREMDKNATKRNVGLLMEFLVQAGFEGANGKAMSAPSDKEFVQVMAFLMNRFDPAYYAVIMKNDKEGWPDKVINFFKVAGYPFSMSKSSLQSVGAPHAWPVVLAALIWLIQAMDFDALCEIADPYEHFVFDKLSVAYPMYLSQADNENRDEEFLENEIERSLKTEVDSIAAEIKAFEKDASDVIAEIVDLEKKHPSVATLTAQQAGFSAQIANLKSSIATGKEEFENLLSTLEASKSEYLQAVEDLAATEQEHANLINALNIQEANLPDIKRMLSEKSLLEDTLTALSKQFDEITKRKKDCVSNALVILDKIVSDCVKYNELAKNLEMTPVDARNANGVHLEVTVKFIDNLKYALGLETLELTQSELANINMNELVSLNMKTQVKPVLTKLKEQFGEKLKMLSKDVRDASRKLSELNEKFTDKSDELNTLTTRFNKLDKAYKEDREVMNTDLKATVSSVEDLELSLRDVTHSIGVCNSTKSGLMVKAEQLLLEKESVEKNIQQSRDNWEVQIYALVDLLSKHKLAVTQKLEETLRKTQRMKTSVM